ncbi:PAS domain S-box protein [Caulobacter soli]|uniref:PAS domain S-box protein n=1 Tax=Caulobacter soli TaxID=2708539 RepID=UPI0013EB8167|nr:PAS domain S-box protein [Caulobacter soli]
MSDNEAKRIRALQSYGVLDTSPDVSFDRITQLACDLFDAPIALVSLIDEDRQWFKSRQGISDCSTPRGEAFCSVAIEQGPDALMIVEDATLHPRFASYPSVTGDLGVRFYVGAVLTSPEGYNLGTLCVIDTKPRPRPTDRDLDRLRALARIVVDQLERLRVNRVRWEQARLLKLAETMSGVAHWRYDVVTGEMYWSDLLYEIRGVRRHSYVPTLETGIQSFHPDDQAMVSGHLLGAIATQTTCNFQARLIRADGEVRVVQSKAGCELDERGEVVALIGLFQDVTEQVRNLENLTASEGRYRLLAENTSDVIVRAALDGTLLYVSPACRAMGYEPEDLVGTAADRLVHPEDRERFLANSKQLYTGETPDPMANRQHRYLTGDGRWVWFEGNPQIVRDAEGRATEIVNVFRDVTERRELQERAERMARMTALAEEVVGLGYWRVEMATGEITWSPHVATLYGLDPASEPRLDQFIAAVHPDDLAAQQARLQLAREQGIGWKLAVTRILLPNGGMRYLEGHGNCERDATGQVVAVFGAVIDITAKVTAEISRAEDEARYRAMSERVLLATQAGQIGVWEWNIEVDRLVWDERMCALYGVEACETQTAQDFLARVHPEDRDDEQRLVRAALAGEAAYDTEFRIVRPGGEVRSIRALATLVRDADGAPVKLVGTNWDVTTVRNLERSLRASEDRARNVIANAHQAIVTADETGRITGWNRYAELTFGWSAQEAIGADLTMILPAGHAGVAAFLGGGFGDDIDQRIETKAWRKDGVEIPIELAASAVRDAAGWELTALMQDISERKEQLELFENAFEHAPIGKCLVGLDGSFLRVNPTLCEMVGYSREELLALDFQAITHPDDLDADLSLVTDLFNGVISTYRMDKRYIRKDGSIVWIQLAVSRVDNPDGSPRYFISQIEDLTARRAAEIALKDSEARYRLMAENTTDMIITADLSGRVTFVAASCRTLLGYAPDEVVGRSALDLAYLEDRLRVRQVYRGLTRGKPAERVRWRVPHKSAERDVWLESNPSLLRDQMTDAPTGFLDVIRDVTDQVAQEEALAAARAEAEAAAAVKGEFMANMSHEIRTPLTAVIGFSGLLNQRPDLDEVSRRYVQRVSSAGQALLAIVNDVLDFSKLEAGQVEITPRPASPLGVAQDALALFAPQADAKGLWLECEAEGDLPAQVMIDPDRVRQVLLNLVGNAVKFTEHGAVRLFVGYDADTATLRMRVEDTGAGMSAEQQTKLFQRFSQVDASSTRKHGGTGLGLAICKGLTEAMDGGITVTSVPGQGTVFSFHIAAEVVAGAAVTSSMTAPAADVRRLDGVRVLVVDDNFVNRELARTVLEHMGAEVAEAGGGRAAIDAASIEPFDCILMDLRMPGVSGSDALCAIRDTSGPNQDVPILAFTADADLGLLGQDHGFDGLVSKPIMAGDLIEAVDQCTRWSGVVHDVDAPGAVEA